MNETDNSSSSKAIKIVAAVLGVPWVEVAVEAWKFAGKILRGMTHEGMYDVLEYESTLDLQDKEGKRAVFRKISIIRSIWL